MFRISNENRKHTDTTLMHDTIVWLPLFTRNYYKNASRIQRNISGVKAGPVSIPDTAYVNSEYCQLEEDE